jgi:hypothetical protein
MPTLLQRLKLRPKLAALGVVGVALCVLPLVQLLRFQGLEILAIRSAEAGMDPALAAMSLQRGLVGHRDAARRWLAGDEGAAAARRVQQAAVDARLTELRGALDALGTPHAQIEVYALHDDWQRLLPQVERRRITVPASDAAHRLLLEQAIQLLDLLAWSPAGPGLPDRTFARHSRELFDAEPAEAAWQAHWAAGEAQLAALRESLAQRRRAAEAARALGLALLAGAALLAAGLARSLRRSLRALDAAPPPAPHDGQADVRRATQDALAGLREPPAAPPLARPPSARSTREPTRPAPLDET